MPEASFLASQMKRSVWVVWSVLLESYRRFSVHGCPTMSAAIAFYTLLGLIPLALLAISVLGHVLGEEYARREVIGLVREAAPGTSHALIGAMRAISGQKDRWFINIVGLVGLLWSGMNLLGSLSAFLTQAWTGESDRRAYVRQKLVALAAVASAGALFLLSIAFASLVSSARESVELSRHLVRLNAPVGGVLAFLGSVIMFFLLYRFLPAARVSSTAAAVGALSAAILWHITRSLFMALVASSSRYGEIYGPLAGVVIFLLWIFYTAMILLFCAEIAAVYQGRIERGSRPTPQPGASS